MTILRMASLVMTAAILAGGCTDPSGQATTSQSPGQENTKAFGEAVNGLRLTLIPLYNIDLRSGANVKSLTLDDKVTGESTREKGSAIGGPLEILDDKGPNVVTAWYCLWTLQKYYKLIFRKDDMVRKQMAGYFSMHLENVSQKPLAFECDWNCNVYVKCPDGKIVLAAHQKPIWNSDDKTVVVAPGKTGDEFIEPWPYKPSSPGKDTVWVDDRIYGPSGEYIVWVELEQKASGNDRAKGYWAGKVRSNAVKVTIEDDKTGH